MRLTELESRMLRASEGESTRKAMRLLTGLGDFYGADRLIPVGSCQISGVSYKTGGEALISVLETMVAEGVTVSVPSYLNPAGMDLCEWEAMGICSEFAGKQKTIISLYKTMGIKALCSCTPYNVVKPPRLGEHVAWGESSAVAYCNSVLGAKTNREGALSALASAIIGKTPNYGLHLDKNRAPTHRFEVRFEMEELDFPILGKHIGREVKGGIPFISGIHEARPWQLKALGAAMAATGSVALFHMEGITPEAHMHARSRSKTKVITQNVIEKIRRSERTKVQADLVVFGCPHCDIEELEAIAGLLGGRKVAKGINLWVFVPRALLARPKAKAATKAITKAGGSVFCDTCCVVSPLEDMGFKGVMTNSGKASVYLKNLSGTPPVLASTEDCVRHATIGV